MSNSDWLIALFVSAVMWPITTDVNAATNQSEHEANTYSWSQVRENVCEQETIVIDFCFSLVEEVARILQPIRERNKAKNHGKRKITSLLN